ncbi:MAG: glycoside hydrolase family 31 protein [Chthoniobacterales bacterium]
MIKLNHTTLPILLVCLMSTAPITLRAAVEQVQPHSRGASLQLTEGRLQVDFVTDRIARVRATKNADWSKTPSLMRVEVAEVPGRIRVKESSATVELRSDQLIVRIDRATEAVSYFDADGKPLLTEHPSQPRTLERVEVIKSLADPASVTKVTTVDGERERVGNYIQRKDRDAWRGKVSFRFAKDEALYGLGFDETSDLNLRGTTKRLYQHNLRILIPSLVSTRGYGLLFDAYSAMTFADGTNGGSMTFDVIDDLDYYFIAGPDMDGAVAGYRQLTGQAAMLPRWAYGYVQSKERYKTQDELVATVKEFRDRKIPLDVIVQDWSYWISSQWGGDVDTKRYPDVAKMIRDIHKQDARVIISIWPNPSDLSTAGKALKDAGHTLAGTPFIDFSNPEARKLYWETAAWKPFGQHGMDGWWCDSTEPENVDWQKDRPADPDSVNIAGLAKIIDPQYLNAYGLWSGTGIFKNQRASAPDRRVLNLTRSTYAGGQRTGSVIWTGDITASWETLAKEVASMQSMSAAGYPYVTTDTGGFFVARKAQWFWRGQFDKGVADLGYRELYTRWLQFGAFLPMFRSHGTDTPREPWRFGEPGTPFYDAIIGTIDLRYRLLPHLYSLSGRVARQNASWIRPVAFSFPEDAKTHDLKTQFMVGDELMIAPVLAPKLYGRDSTPVKDAPGSVDVYLPKNSAWIDFWTGRPLSGGQTVKADAPLSHSPLFVKAGSILPLGPRVQHSGEAPSAPLELRVYPGADGSYLLYEDQGDGWGYEKGAYSVIPITWNDRTRTLVIGARRSEFPGMLKIRTFRVVLVAPGAGTGIEAADTAAEVRYDGRTFNVPLPASAQPTK